MKRLTESYKEYISRFPEEKRGASEGYSMRSDIIYERLGAYEDLEEKGELLRNPQKVKNDIIERMEVFIHTYQGYAGDSVNYLLGKEVGMETAMRIVKAVFSDAMDTQKENDK